MAEDILGTSYVTGVMHRQGRRGAIPEEMQVYTVAEGHLRVPLDRIVESFAMHRPALGRSPDAIMGSGAWKARPHPGTDPATPWPGAYDLARTWYQPRLADLYESSPARSADLEQLGAIAAIFETRGRFLAELALDPPGAISDEAGTPHLDEDYLILSTIHSAKGQEWTHVYVLRVSDGCIPSDMACGSPEEIEEERRLLYVAMTRTRDELHLVHPQRFYTYQQARNGDRHVYAPRSRFLADEILRHFKMRAVGHTMGTASLRKAGQSVRVDIGNQMVNMWR